MYGQTAVSGYVGQPSTGNQGRKYASSQAMGLGVTQILIGILCIIVNSAAIAISALYAEIASGLWAGILFIIAGSLGVASAKNPRTGLLVGTMVMSIIAALIAINPITFGAISYAGEDNYYSYYYYTPCGWWSSTNCINTTPNRDAQKAMDMSLVVLATIEFIAAIWQSALPCAYKCCCDSPQNRVTLVQGATPAMMIPHHNPQVSSAFVVQGSQPPAPQQTMPGTASQVIHPQGQVQTQQPQPSAVLPNAVPDERNVPVIGQPVVLPNTNSWYYPVQLLFSTRQPAEEFQRI